MQEEVLIRAEHVSKKFCRDLKKSLWYGMQDLGKAAVGISPSQQLRPHEFWAVNDISFEVKRGECLGLIGHNGAGKSTLLKMLNGLLTPDKGSIEMKGRVGALIELGAGFNPILTGRENIFNNAAILGFSKKETLDKLDEIIAFADIEDFLDTPVQNYSSGMRVRLGFAVAAQMKPDILIIDEVLAVGDMGFVLKCFNRMDELLKDTALILVSHSMPQIARMCTQVLLMSKGQNQYLSNDVSTGITRYYEMFGEEINSFSEGEKVDLSDITLLSEGNKGTRTENLLMDYAAPLEIQIEITCREAVEYMWVYLAFYDKEQRIFAEVNNFTDALTLKRVENKVIVSAYIPSLPFAQGAYSISVGIGEEQNGARRTLLRSQSAIYFTVHGKHHGWAPIQYEPEWKLL
ncbi:MAG: ABC transporter ATP-binding protein [Flavobacteriales bacterium]|nr:ABC transporter ATP-binding protein [Flavobacteriales bacterium]